MNEMQKTANNRRITENGMERDSLKVVEYVFDYLDEHPHIGAIGGGTIAVLGLGALIYYGSKL